MHTSTFRVRVFDVDAYNEIRPSRLIVFFQQAASDASAAAGYDYDWYERAGALWVIRRTTADFLAPVFFRDELRVRTWVSDLRRVRSLREYAVERAGDGLRVARGLTDWVYVDLARGVPVRPPPEMQQRLMPGIGPRPRPPSAGAAAPAWAACSARRVEFVEIDSAAHVNNAHYAVYAEQAVFDSLAQHGWRVDPQDRAQRLRVLSHDLEYFAEAQYGDLLEAAVWTGGMEDAEFTSECALSRGPTRILHATTRWAWSAPAPPAGLAAAVAALAGRAMETPGNELGAALLRSRERSGDPP